MKSFKQYLTESEYAATNPMIGDVVAINIREECLLETYVIDEDSDSITLYADDKFVDILESYGYIGEKMIDVDGTDVDQYTFDTEEEVAEDNYPGSQGTWVHGESIDAHRHDSRFCVWRPSIVELWSWMTHFLSDTE